jgi:SAM-dependent methyltransferase
LPGLGGATIGFCLRECGAMATESAHALRDKELDLAVRFLPEGGSVLELGAGDGWQARALHERGFEVTAVDIATPRVGQSQYYPVVYYDGRSLPFPDDTFDAVYSSSVLEHVADFDSMQRELARVLRAGGVAVHCVPSAVWRFWTTASHPFYSARWLLRLRRGDPFERQKWAATGREEQAIVLKAVRLAWRGLVSPRHGEQGNMLSEHWRFSRWGWNRSFRRSGWHVECRCPTQLFYTGNEILGVRFSSVDRNRVAALLGSSTLIYVLRP